MSLTLEDSIFLILQRQEERRMFVSAKRISGRKCPIVYKTRQDTGFTYGDALEPNGFYNHKLLHIYRRMKMVKKMHRAGKCESKRARKKKPNTVSVGITPTAPCLRSSITGSSFHASTPEGSTSIERNSPSCLYNRRD